MTGPEPQIGANAANAASGLSDLRGRRPALLRLASTTGAPFATEAFMEITALSSIVTSKFPFELVEHFDLSTSYLKLSLRSDGSIAHFRSLPGGKDYLAGPTAPVWFMRITDKDGGVFKSKSISRTESTLRVGFEGSSVTAKVHVREWPAYLTFELTAIDDHTISSITLLDLPLTLTQHVSSALASCRDGGYAAAVVPLNIQTHSRPIPGSAHAALVAEADGRVRLEGAKFALVGCVTTRANFE